MFNGSPSALFEQRLIQKMLDSNRKDSSKNTSVSFRRFDLEVCVDIGDGTQGLIRLNSNSHPLQCALEFCKQHNIDKSVAPLLAESIMNELREEVNENSGSPVLKHRLSQSMVEEKRPELKQITNRIPSVKHKRRRESEIVERTNNRSRKRTQPVKQKQIEQQFNYRPKINQISKQIVEKLNKRNIVETVQQNKKKKEQNITKIRKQNDMREIIQCSFKPKINIISEKVDNQMKRNTKAENNRYQQLYMNSFIQENSKQHSRKTSYQKNTFKPEINKISKTIMTGVNFEQRQQKFRKKTVSQSISTFKPKTGRQPKDRNINNLPIGEYLYEQGKQRLMKKSIQSTNISRRASVVSNRSEQLFTNLKINKLREIFDLLDVKRTGSLEYDDLDLDNLDEDTINIFLPIFQQMKQIEVSLNIQQFIEAGSRLIQNLTPQQRGVLFNTKKKTQIPQQFPFHPQINKNPKSISNNVDRERKDIYVRCLMERKMHKQKVQQTKQELVKSQLCQCTFKPKINRIERDII